MSLERRLLSRLVDDPEAIAEVWEMGLKAKVFEEPLSQYVYSFVIDYWLDSKKTAAPTAYVIETERPGFKVESDVEEESWWLAEQLMKRFSTNGVQEMMRQAVSTCVSDPIGTLQKLQEDSRVALEAVPEAERHKHLRDRVLTLEGLLNLPSVEPLISGLIYRDTLAQLAGPPGCYKSFLAVAASCSLAAGIDLGPFQVPEARTVVYAVAEGANGMAARILAWCEAWNVEPALLFKRLHVLPLPIQLGEGVDVSEAAELVRELDADLLVLDTRARCTVGLEENSATEQGKAIEAAESIRRANSCAVWVVHHAPREGNAGRGSNAWDGAVWSDLRMKREGLHATVHCEKHKDVPDGCDHQFFFVPHTVSPELMPDDKEEERRTLVLVQNEVWTGAVLANSRLKVLEVIRKTAPPEGLTRPELANFAKDIGVSKSSTYESVNELVREGLAKNVGSDKKARYVAAEQSPQ
jgi:AAA domain